MRIVRKLLAFGIVAALISLGWDHAAADVAVKGSFTATKACPALQSIRKATNPGSVAVVPGQTYEAIAKNSDAATHYRIRIDAAVPKERWVSIDCGTFAGTVADGGSAAGSGARKAEAVLALSWEPSFCEAHADKPECAKETEASFEATHLVLHGLWPQPRSREYCNVEKSLVSADKKGDWASLPAVDLSPETRARLDKAMPGTQSSLERHEWIRHGSCYNGLDKEAYFKQALSLVDEVNASAVQAFLSANVGKEVTGADIRAAFDKTFGAGTGDRVRISCAKDGSRRLIVEITIGLAGMDGNLADMTKAAGATDAGCQSGIVDPTGLQ